MKSLTLSLIYAVAVASLVVAGCAQASTPPTPAAPSPIAAKAVEPTKAPAQPTKAPEPAKPTASPVQKVSFPEKGRAINLIVPWNAGGGTDIAARVLAPLMEKELGTPIQVINKVGAGSQVGITELVNSKPDGHTIAATSLPATNGLYLDARRQAIFSRKDFQPLVLQVADPGAIGVRPDSPYKTLKDLIDAAKAKPESIKAGATGIMSGSHLALLQVEKLAGVKFATVQFDGSAPAQTALLGGHIDLHFAFAGEFYSHVKSGQTRILGVMDKEESKYLLGAKTLEAQGYKLYWYSSRGYALPANTPSQVVDILATAAKKAIETEQHSSKMEEVGQPVRYMGPSEFATYWDQVDAQVKPLVELVQ